jgi:hypothetical protein
MNAIHSSTKPPNHVCVCVWESENSQKCRCMSSVLRHSKNSRCIWLLHCMTITPSGGGHIMSINSPSNRAFACTPGLMISIYRADNTDIPQIIIHPPCLALRVSCWWYEVDASMYTCVMKWCQISLDLELLLQIILILLINVVHDRLNTRCLINLVSIANCAHNGQSESNIALL